MSNNSQKSLYKAPKINPNELQEAQQNKDLDYLYFNSFIVGLAGIDIILLLKQNNNQKLLCNFSLPMAKSLAMQLNSIIAQFETFSESQILTMEVVDQVLRKMGEIPNDNK